MLLINSSYLQQSIKMSGFVSAGVSWVAELLSASQKPSFTD